MLLAVSRLRKLLAASTCYFSWKRKKTQSATKHSEGGTENLQLFSGFDKYSIMSTIYLPGY